MTLETSVLLSLLKLTQTGPTREELLSRDSRIPLHVARNVLTKLSTNNLIDESEGIIEASSSQRVRMAVHALKSGADVERVSSLLSWTEFETIAAQAFEANGYRVVKNLHFKQASKRWEIDVVGFRKPLVVCADCKHWKRGWRSAATTKAVEAQTERTKAFADALPKYSQRVGLEGWQNATVIPVVVSFFLGPHKFYNDVPVVPILQLQDFINELPTQVHLLKSFNQKHVRLNKDLQKLSQ